MTYISEEELVEHVFETVGLSHMLHLLAQECKERAEYLDHTQDAAGGDADAIERYAGLGFAISAVAYGIEAVADLAEKGEPT